MPLAEYKQTFTYVVCAKLIDVQEKKVVHVWSLD